VLLISPIAKPLTGGFCAHAAQFPCGAEKLAFAAGESDETIKDVPN
jgi:hypothetical protein